MKLKEFLCAIEDGQTSFEPSDGSDHELVRFQSIYRLAERAAQDGYIEIVNHKYSSEVGIRLCVIFVVLITPAGLVYLKSIEGI